MKNGIALGGGLFFVAAIAGLLLGESKGEKFEKPDDDIINESFQNNPKQLESRGNIHSQGSIPIMEMPQNYIASQGEMLVEKNGKKLLLPLLHTNVFGDIEGFLARVTVTQTYVNTFESAIEALYTFPLPENAAVDSMILQVGDKRIKGIIKERQEARDIYENARKQGKTASLLEQQRPNIFTQSVANILPGDTIVITISYLQQLKFISGKYLFNFPMVVGPRYIPGQPLRSEAIGTENPTEQVPDAHKITPPILPSGTRSGHDITLQIKLHKSMSIQELTSPSHRIIISENDSSKIIGISPNDRIPNKDFMLEYIVAGDEISSVFLTHKKRVGEGFFQLIMIPKIDITEKEIFPRELVFVVDNSGSMGGFPLDKCKELMRISLQKMRHDDLFRVIKFAGSTETLSSQALHATDANVKMALDFVDNMSGGGGTEMMNAISAIFDAPRIDGHKRLVLFMTDGYVGNEREIISTIQKRLGDNRVFSLGVGSSVNRYLLEGMGYAGRGDCMIIRQDGEAQKVIDEFYTKIDAPVLADLSLAWEGVEVIDPQPAQLPDLFQSQPLVITGMYTKGGKGILTIQGKLSGGRVYQHRMDVLLPDINEANSVLPPLWARKKIEVIDLLGSQLFDESSVDQDNVKESITKLGLEYKIMTKFTSFVAVDEAIRSKSGDWVSMEQPVELPEGVSDKSQPGYRYAGGGDPKCRMAKSGVLGVINGQMNGRSSSSADVYGNGGYAKGMDAIISGAGGLKSGGSGAVGRKGVAGIGYGTGYGGSSSCNKKSLSMNSTAERKSIISAPEFLKGASLTGARSNASVMRVVMQNLAALRYAYSKRLRDNPGLKGKIAIKFRIDANGTVIFCELVSTTVNDAVLENEIIVKIKRWTFEKIDKPGDITEVVYPFVFSM